MGQKKIKTDKIGTAVFRGRKTIYNFEVFPLETEELADKSGVYIISRRKTDERGKGHHLLVSVGQTAELEKEIAKQRKLKTVKKKSANVVCLHFSEDEKQRLKIEEDLRSAHSAIFDMETAARAA